MALALAGCGDPLLCKSDVFVAIQTREVAVDIDADAAGVQTNLAVRTSLDPGTTIELQIRDTSGHTTQTASAIVDASGEASVRVTLPEPRAQVTATGSGLCGEGADVVTVEVSAGATCTVALAPPPHAAPYYTPLGVLVAADDTDPQTAGLQARAAIGTRLDWLVDVFVGGSMGERAVATDVPLTGNAVPITLPEGQATVRAVCHDVAHGAELATPATTLVVDSIAPACDIASPADHTTITPAFDFDHDPSNGIQLPIAVRADNSRDVEGEAFTVTATPNGAGAPVIGTGTFDDHASGSTIVTVGTATYAVVLQGHDHAGNPCFATRTYPVDITPP